MEEGKLYDVWYRDDDRTRHKILRFKSAKDGLINFSNPSTEKEETLPVNGLVRIQGRDGRLTDEKDTPHDFPHN